MLNLMKKFWNWGWSIYHKNEEVWNYLISGALGVVISVASYALCSRLLMLNVIVSNIISWIIAVISMYLMNKAFVFKSKCENNKEVFKEFFSFIIARILTLIIETGILYIGAEYLKINDVIVKVIAQIIVIILNYIFSKLWIFKKNK